MLASFLYQLCGHFSLPTSKKKKKEQAKPGRKKRICQVHQNRQYLPIVGNRFGNSYQGSEIFLLMLSFQRHFHQ